MTVVILLSITFLIDKNNEIKRIYGIEMHELHTSATGGNHCATAGEERAKETQ